ncbi:hypothetical protein CYANOKiyG1_38820 [Okeania sp. KiyG1]|nr:hypothetical protein CYANOKiyG1_38820 [Okeania sp. KiyG1]
MRPFITKWHSNLQVWEAQKPDDVSPKEYEVRWIDEPEARKELEILRGELNQYAQALAEIAGVEYSK